MTAPPTEFTVHGFDTWDVRAWAWVIREAGNGWVPGGVALVYCDHPSASLGWGVCNVNLHNGKWEASSMDLSPRRREAWDKFAQRAGEAFG